MLVLMVTCQHFFGIGEARMNVIQQCIHCVWILSWQISLGRPSAVSGWRLEWWCWVCVMLVKFRFHMDILFLMSQGHCFPLLVGDGVIQGVNLFIQLFWQPIGEEIQG